MTLIITVVKPREGAWQSVDNRVKQGGRIKDDDSRKHISLRGSDGTALLAFTGLAALYPGNTSISDWIRSTLRGANRTIEQHLLHLTDRATRDISSGPWRHDLLIIHTVALRGTGSGWRKNELAKSGTSWVYEISNGVKTPSGNIKVGPSFDIKVVRIDEPMYFTGGSGEKGIREPEHERLQRALRQRPKRPENYQGLLAAVNRRAARRVESVSPWCQTVFVPPTGEPFRFMLHRRPGDVAPTHGGPIPVVHLGLDMTEIMATLPKMWESDAAKLLDDATRRSVDPRT